jgi:tetratricopeptide (TPR) repeat protein
MIRIRSVVAWVTMLTGLAGPSEAQQYQTRLVNPDPQQLGPTLCNLRGGGGGKVGDGQKQVRNGIEDKDPAKRAAALVQAEKILATEVAGAAAQNAAAWYWLGRAYLARGDVVGADSAFDRTERLAPDCEIDIDQHRQTAWQVLATAGLEALGGQPSDTAQGLAFFRASSVIFDKLPHVFENMGVVFANLDQADSAMLYFSKAAAIAETDTALVANRNSATHNLALMQQRAGQHREAAATFEKYLQWATTSADSTDATKGLIFSLRESGEVARADSLQHAMVEELARMNLDSLSTTDLMDVGVSLFNGKQFQEAAAVFTRLMARNRWSRDAVYNLANSYLALKESESLVRVGRQLIEIEPLNEDAYRLVGQGFREMKQEDSLLKVVEALVGLPVKVEVTAFVMNQNGARFTATATGRESSDARGTILKPVPVTVTIEFLDLSGNVIGTEEIGIPALGPGATHTIQTEVQGQGIEGWRYRRK